MSVTVCSRAQIAGYFMVPAKVIPGGLTAKTLAPRIEAYAQNDRRWLLEGGVGQNILASSNFKTDFRVSMERVDRLIGTLQRFGFEDGLLRQAVVRTIEGKSLNPTYLDNLSMAAHVAQRLNFSQQARQQITEELRNFIFDAETRKSFLSMVYKMLKVAQAESLLETMPGIFYGIKREMLKLNLGALDRLSRILLVSQENLEARYKAFNQISFQDIYPLKNKAAFRYVCVELTEETLRQKAEALITKYGFTQEVFDANPELMYVTVDKVSPSYAATAFLGAAKAAVEKGQLEQALELAKKAQNFKGHKLCHRVANVVDYFPEALEKLMAAQKLLDFEAIRDLLRDAYQLCLRSERKNTTGSESRYCEPIIERIKVLMADTYLAYFREKAANGDQASKNLVALLDQWEEPLKKLGVFHYFMLLCVVRQLETMHVPDSAKEILNKFADQVLEILARTGKANKGQLERILKQQSSISVVGNVMLGILAVGRPFYGNRLDISLLTLAKWFADGRPNQRYEKPKKTLKKVPKKALKKDPPKTQGPKIALNLSQFIQNINRARILAMSLDDVINIQNRISRANQIFELLHYTPEDVARFSTENKKISAYFMVVAQLRSKTADLIFGFGGIDASHPDLSDQLREYLLKFAQRKK